MFCPFTHAVACRQGSDAHSLMSAHVVDTAEDVAPIGQELHCVEALLSWSNVPAEQSRHCEALAAEKRPGSQVMQAVNTPKVGVKLPGAHTCAKMEAKCAVLNAASV